jgi:hypothetical protein
MDEIAIEAETKDGTESSIEIEPKIETVDALRARLQNAIALEFTTIPAYLSGWFTIKDRERFWEVSKLLRSIIIAEMRHMAIACNTLIAMDGTPDILHAVPVYPCRLPDQSRHKLVKLLPFGKNYWELGLFIEQPEELSKPCSDYRIYGEIDLTVAQKNESQSTPFAFDTHVPLLLSGYDTIGAFYEAIIQGIERLVKHQGEAYVFPYSRQIDRQYIHFGGQENIGVTGSGDAITLLRDIIGEGEGKTDQMWDENGELAHYYSFDQLRRKASYQRTDPRCKPSVPLSVPQSADVVWIPKNPMMAAYEKFPEAKQRAHEFNELYKRLVTNLHIGFTKHPQQIDTAIGQMHQLEALAMRVLSCEVAPAGGQSVYAAPTFEIPPYRTIPQGIDKAVSFGVSED